MDSAVFEQMTPYLIDEYGNASSTQHKLGRAANHAVEAARQIIGNVLSVQPKEITFSSGATESINFVIKGIAERYASIGKHIITTTTEHKAVLGTCEQLQKKGYRITYLPVNEQGLIDLQELEEAIASDTILVTIMLANNETGVRQPVEEIGKLCRSKKVLFFCDATQGFGKLRESTKWIEAVDICCLSAHKIHGPKGIGLTVIKRRSSPIQTPPLIIGGHQEGGLRGGTYPVHQIVGMAKAIELTSASPLSKIESLRNDFEAALVAQVDEVYLHGNSVDRLVNTSNIEIRHVRSAELMSQLPEIALSSGSACVTGTRDPSHVLKAMSLTDEQALCSIRVSLSKFTTKKEIENAVESLAKGIKKIRENSPIWQMYTSGLL